MGVLTDLVAAEQDLLDPHPDVDVGSDRRVRMHEDGAVDPLVLQNSQQVVGLAPNVLSFQSFGVKHQTRQRRGLDRLYARHALSNVRQRSGRSSPALASRRKTDRNG